MCSTFPGWRTSRGAGARVHGDIARRAGDAVGPLPVGPNEEEQFVDALIGPDVGDVLDVFRGGVPARGAGARGHGDVARRAGHVVEPLAVGPNKEEQFVDALIGPDIGDVLDVFRGRVPARGAGARGHGDIARRAGDAVGPLAVRANEEEQFVDALIGPDVGDVLDVFRGGVPARGAGARGHGDVARRAGHVVERTWIRCKGCGADPGERHQHARRAVSIICQEGDSWLVSTADMPVDVTAAPDMATVGVNFGNWSVGGESCPLWFSRINSADVPSVMQFGAVGLTEHKVSALTHQQGWLLGLPFGVVQLNTAPDW